MISRFWRRFIRPLGVGAIVLIVLVRAMENNALDPFPAFVETALALFAPIALLVGMDTVIRRVSTEQQRMNARNYAAAIAVAVAATVAISGLTAAVSYSKLLS